MKKHKHYIKTQFHQGVNKEWNATLYTRATYLYEYSEYFPTQPSGTVEISEAIIKQIKGTEKAAGCKQGFKYPVEKVKEIIKGLNVPNC